MPYERENIHRLDAYVPGEQPGYAETGVAGGVIKLNTNENPFPPHPAVIEAIRSVPPEALRLYPPAAATPFRREAARVHGLKPEQVIPTNGGDELLRLLVSVFCLPSGGQAVSEPVFSQGAVLETGSSARRSGGVGMTNPSYSLYGVLAGIHDTPLTVIERNADYSLPVDLAEQWNQAGCRLAFLVNPHAPTGRIESLETLEAIARQFQGVLVIDEAYVDFAPQDALPLIRGENGLRNVLILRSLSKGYSLAGLRFGYGLGHPVLIAAMDKARDSYNTDILSQIAATAALRHRDQIAQGWEQVKAERQRLTAALAALGFVVLPSHTNFLLCTPPVGGPGAKALYEGLKARNILVRYFSAPRLADKLRITVGTPEQDDAVLAALRELLAPVPA